ncbi:SymE family type I addiction module toxin [Caballeronia sp. AZ1_KS37]|uniref:SymE family type I addiction module toxin n=1 Tax=Caballeronia sp. AZ1_KS37 TaxID=2921756 RepID=UPI0032EF2E2F
MADSLNACRYGTKGFVTHSADPALPENWTTPSHLRTEPPLYRWRKLAGRWIEHAGFQAGQRVRTNVVHGRLTTTAE